MKMAKHKKDAEEASKSSLGGGSSGNNLHGSVDDQDDGQSSPRKSATRPQPALPPIRADKYCQLSIFTNQEFTRVTMGVLAEVNDLHKQGIVHGDIKPENVRRGTTGVWRKNCITFFSRGSD